jgi:hypothetical protein
MFRHAPVVPMWGGVGIAADTIATAVILPVITCVVVTALTRWHVRAGRLPPLHPPPSAGLLARAPHGTWRRASVFAALSAATLAPATLVVLAALDVAEMSVRDFLVWKAAFAVADGLLVTPPLAYLALLAASRPAARLLTVSQ